MQNILIVGLPSTGVTLMTKMLAKELSDRNKRVVIKDGSQTGRTFESFALNGLDVKSGLVDYDGIDIARSSIDVESYDVCLTEATIMEMNLTKEELQVFDQIVIVANGNIHRKMRTERFIKDNDLRNIKLIVNLSYIGDFDYADGYVDYVAFIGMDGRIQAIDAEGEKKGKILLSKMPKDFRKQITALALEIVPAEEKSGRLWPKLLRTQSDKSEKKGEAVNV